MTNFNPTTRPFQPNCQSEHNISFLSASPNFLLYDAKNLKLIESLYQENINDRFCDIAPEA